jgi:uncharacterized RDD family membrane protein YckC
MAVVYVLAPLRGPVTAIINALMLSAFGATPGKWLCGVRVVRKDGAPLAFVTALKRELAALILGCGLYLPLIGIIAMGIGHTNLRRDGATSWDAGRGLLVLQRRNGFGQFMRTSLAVMLLAFVLGGVAAVIGAARGATGQGGG